MIMSFTESLRNCLTVKFCSTKGRASRSEYWWFVLFASVVGGVLQNVPVAGQLISLVLLIPHICVTSRRLHDIGWSGWWQIMPLALIFFGVFSVVFDASGIVCMLSILGGILFGLYFGVRKGTAPGEPNIYGGAPDAFCKNPRVDAAPSGEEGFIIEEEKDSATHCINCGKAFARGDRFCGNCGHPYPQPPRCPSCGKVLTEDSLFCTSCGAKLKD
ncbi:MAG: DUF805 domain-containing protein [Mailhella sp.]|nr:DUF805 domain-containing protein [Mailhella sp.]